MDKIKQFYDIIFRDYVNSDGFLNYRKITSGQTIQKFTQDKETLINATVGQTDIYFGVAVRKEKNGKAENVLYANVMFIDVDFHSYAKEEYPELKKKAINIIANDIFLKQFCAIVDTGRGLHIYYQLPKKTFVDNLKIYYSRLLSYAEGIDFIRNEGILDGKVVKDVARILRCPGSINSNTNTEATILAIDKNVVIDENFLKYLKDIKTPEKNKKSKYSVARAMELCGYEPTPGVNVICPFPDHNDNNASFRYYEESDTFWCYGCSDRGDKKYYDGIDFLILKQRQDLIPQLKAEAEAEAETETETEKYVLEPNGKLCVKSKKGNKMLCDFLSSNKIEAYSPTFGRKVYIDLNDSVVDITDYPTNREIKKRYLQCNQEFLLNCAESGFADLLTRFIREATKTDKVVIFNHGVNHYENGRPLFHFNGKTFPEQNITTITAVEPLGTNRKYVSYDFNDFINDLITDNNYSHIIGLMWGISTIARDIIIDRAGLFPILIATGIRESGKTQLARMIINMFGYDRSEEMDTTSFAMIKKLERYGTLPVHFDEFSNKKRETEHEELIKDLSTSKILVRERGNISQKTDKFYLQCPIIITGEKNINDAGIVSRAIILNLGKSSNKNNLAFQRWVNFFKSGKLLSFMQDFLQNHFYSFRNHYKTVKLSRDRKTVKKEIVFLTLDYLEENGLINKIDRELLETILADTEVYKKSISSDGYTEILSDVLTENFDPEKGYESFTVSKITDSFYFSLKYKVVFVNIPALFEVYKFKVKDAMRRIPSISDFKINFIQSPDIVGTTGRGKRMYIKDFPTNKEKEKRLNEAIVLRISQYNYDYMRYVLLYKLLPKYTKNIEVLEKRVDEILTKMQKNNEKFIDNQTGYRVL